MQICAHKVITRHKDLLPDLSSIIILLPHSIQVPRVRYHLLRFASEITHTHVLIPPTITTLTNLFQHQYPNRTYISSRQCKLLLGASLYDNTRLFAGLNCWEAASDLLELFNEINEHNAANNTSLPISQESETLAEIYTAWNAAINKETLDSYAYIQALLKDQLTTTEKNIFACGIDSPSPAEQQWLSRKYDEGKLTSIEYSDEMTATGQLLAVAINQDSIPPKERAAEYISQFPLSPIIEKISVFNPENLEQHAFGVQLKIIDLLVSGVEDIAIVTQDRKFARRLRTLLSRRKIPVRDHAGWALSTTSCAAALLHLVPDATQEFTYESLLNVLYSPYYDHAQKTEELRTLRTQFNTELLATPYISGGLDEVLNNIAKTPKISPAVSRWIRSTADILQELRNLCSDKTETPLSDFFDHLLTAMQKLGVEEKFKTDPAGQQILTIIDTLRETAAQEKITGHWSLFRSWLIHTLETENFVPDTPEKGVTFYNLNQSVLLHPQAVILASIDERYEQAARGKTLLSDNDLERLGIKTTKDRIAVLENRLHIILESANQILITYQKKDSTRTLTPAAWVEKLQNFHKIAYADDLIDHELEAAAKLSTHMPLTDLGTPSPRPLTMPTPQSPQHLWPKYLSANAYQSALNCPYQFFSRYCLKLKKPETSPPGYHDRRYYGQIMHRCLGALHINLDDLPGPMDKPWVSQNLDYALRLANDIVTATFSEQAAEDYVASWYMYEAKQILENYVHWLIANDYNTSRFLIEQTETRKLTHLELKGRADCVIKMLETMHLIDYKTGNIPTQKNIANGEDVQIGTYTLLFPKLSKATYLQVQANKAIKPKWMESSEIEELREKHQARLVEFKADYDKQASLRPWADKNTCRFCDYAGICRRPSWEKYQFIDDDLITSENIKLTEQYRKSPV